MAIIEAAKRILNSDKVCHSYSDLNFGVTFFGTQCIYRNVQLFIRSKTGILNAAVFKYSLHKVNETTLKLSLIHI